MRASAVKLPLRTLARKVYVNSQRLPVVNALTVRPGGKRDRMLNACLGFTNTDHRLGFLKLSLAERGAGSTVTRRTDPFAGVDFFKPYDEEVVYVVENVELDGYCVQRLEFYPRVGEMRIRHHSSELNISIEYSERSKEVSGLIFRGADLSLDEMVPGKRQRLVEIAKRRLREAHGVGFTGYPDGYPEVLASFESNEHKLAKVSLADLEPGKIYLTRDAEGTYWLFSPQKIECTVGEPRRVRIAAYAEIEGINAGFGYKLMGKRFQLMTPDSVEGVKYWFTEGEGTTWEVSERLVESVFPFRPPEIDPSAAIGMTREEYSVYVVLEGMQFERWGALENAKHNPQRYAKVTSENYWRVLDELIGRFGLDNFRRAACRLGLLHVGSLHALDSGSEKAHTDMAPLDSLTLKLAWQLVNGIHPLPKNMYEFGSTVNTRPIFADVDFLFYLQYKYPAEFDRFMQKFDGLPISFPASLGDGFLPAGTFTMPELMARFFPEAHRLAYG